MLAAAVCLPRSLGAQSDSVALAPLLVEAERASPRIVAALAAARAASARVASTTRPPDPQLQFGWMNYAVPDFAPMVPLTMRQVQVMQMLPIAGRLRAMRAASEAGVAEASGDARSARAAVRRETATAFFRLHRLDGTLRLAAEARQLAADLREISAAMHRVGEGQQADVLRADVEVARMAAEVDEMLLMRAAAEAELVSMLARAPGSRIAPTTGLQFRPPLPPLDSLMALASTQRPELSRADATSVRAAAMERVARTELWPDLTVGVQLAAGQDGAGMRESMGSLMLGVGVPIYARRRQLQMREEAKAMRDMAIADRAMLAAETGAEVAMAYASLARARTLRERYVTQVLPAAEAARESALAAYRAGTVPFMTALDNQMAVVRYRAELLKLDEDEGIALATLEALTGVAWLATTQARMPGDRDE